MEEATKDLFYNFTLFLALSFEITLKRFSIVMKYKYLMCVYVHVYWSVIVLICHVNLGVLMCVMVCNYVDLCICVCVCWCVIM